MLSNPSKPSSDAGLRPIGDSLPIGCATPARTSASAHSQPKTLKERMQWMADNLPGFGEEVAQANAIRGQSLAGRR